VRQAPQKDLKCWLARTQALYRPMILFQNVVEILHGSMAAVFLQRSFGF
jgi:hypothetical protein